MNLFIILKNYNILLYFCYLINDTIKYINNIFIFISFHDLITLIS